MKKKQGGLQASKQNNQPVSNGEPPGDLLKKGLVFVALEAALEKKLNFKIQKQDLLEVKSLIQEQEINLGINITSDDLTSICNEWNGCLKTYRDDQNSIDEKDKPWFDNLLNIFDNLLSAKVQPNTTLFDVLSKFEKLIYRPVPAGTNPSEMEQIIDEFRSQFGTTLANLQTMVLSIASNQATLTTTMGNLQQTQNLTLEQLQDLIIRQQKEHDNLVKTMYKLVGELKAQLTTISTTLTQVQQSQSGNQTQTAKETKATNRVQNSTQTGFSLPITLNELNSTIARISSRGAQGALVKKRLAVGLRITTGSSSTTLAQMEIKHLVEFQQKLETTITKNYRKNKHDVIIKCSDEFRSYWDQKTLKDIDSIIQNRQPTDNVWGIKPNSFIRMVNTTIKSSFGEQFLKDLSSIDTSSVQLKAVEDTKSAPPAQL